MIIRITVILTLVCGLLAGCGSDSSSNDQPAVDRGDVTDEVQSEPELPDTELPEEDPNVEEDPVIKDEEPVVEALNRYTIANQCYALQSTSSGQFVSRSDAGAYVADADNVIDASDFYLKPTELGKYMLYADNQTLLAVQSDDPTGLANGSGLTDFQLGSVDAPKAGTGWAVNHGVIWEVKEGESTDSFSFSSQVHDNNKGSHMLAVDDNGKLLIAPRAAEDSINSQRFQLVAADQCETFPEISTDVIGHSYKGNGVDQPVVGFSDVHNHISATGFLGGDHVGRPFSQYGVAAALPDGVAEHGPDGRLDLIGNLYGGDPAATHDTQGWPTFQDWPAWDMLTHENTYYKWVERSWQSGLRLMVNNLVQNDALCELNNILHVANPSDPALIDKLSRAVGSIKSFADILKTGPNDLLSQVKDGLLSDFAPETCNDMATALRQATFMYRMENYIDAQNGGPGKGWFRIVKSPEQAREVINEGKLAVVLGIELSNVFDCSVTIVGTGALGNLAELPHCSRETIDSYLELLDGIGVRQINLVHEFNNALGGNGIFNGEVINVGNFADTGQFWRTEPCPDTDYYYSASVDLLSVDPFSYLGDNPLSWLLSDVLLQGLLPAYQPSHQCNKRGITDLGRYALQRVMAKHMMIDVDHMSVKMKSQVIDTAMDQTPMYPVISSHGGHGGITMEQARDIIKTGGLINPIDVSPSALVREYDHLKEVTPEGNLLALSFTSDINGMAAQPGPGGGAEISYPFTLFQGPDWNDKFAGIEPLTFELSCVPEGDRCFDFNKEGIAQYGLYADWVESVRKTAGDRAPAILDALYSSAEHYLQVWERTRNR